MKQLQNFFLNSAYQLILMIIPLFTAPYISRVLGETGIGINSYTANIVQYFVLLSVLGTVNYGSREIAYHQNDRVLRSNIFWEIVVLSWITSLVALIFFGGFVFFSKKYVLVYLFQGFAILSSMFDISWYYAGREKFKNIVFKNLVVKIITVVSIFTFVKSKNDLVLYIAILMIGNFLGSLSLWISLSSEVDIPKFKSLRVFRHLKPTTILFLPTVAISLYTLIDKFLIGKFDSIVNLGYFTLSDMIIRVALTFVTAIMTVMIPHASTMVANGNKEGVNDLTKQIFNLSSGLSIGICSGIAGISITFAPYFFGQEYEKVGVIMMIQALSIIPIGWAYLFGGQYLLPLNRIKEYTVSAYIGAFVSVVLNIIFIPLFGVLAAAGVSVISQISVSFYQLKCVRNEFDLGMMFLGLWKYLVCGILMFASLIIMGKTMKLGSFEIILQVLFGIALYSVLNILLKTNLWLLAKKLIINRRKRFDS